MTAPRGRRRKERVFAKGNACVLVLVNSADGYWNFSRVDPAVLTALDHFGIPYRILDLADRRPAPEDLEDCAALLLAQNRLAQSLTDREASAISDAVDRGMGLVNMDSVLQRCPSALLELFQLERVNPCPAASNILRVGDSGHYITAMQNSGEYHTFDRMVPVTLVETYGEGAIPLADVLLGKDQLVYSRHMVAGTSFEPRNYPALLAVRQGRGRAVQFCINPCVWLPGFYGHARGLDDLLWRSIVWTARKPFAAAILPPFVALSVDDCSGRLDFGYADVACRHGYVPMPSLFLDTVPRRLFPKIREGVRSGAVHYNTHAFDYYHLLTFDFGRGELDAGQLQRNFEREDAWWKEVGIRQGMTMRCHWGETGVAALPFLKARNRLFFNVVRETGLTKPELSLRDGYWPFGLFSCFYDVLPDDNDFFVFASVPGSGMEDFLSGCTALLAENPCNNIEKAAENGVRHFLLGLRGGFPGEIITHEQKFDVLSLAEWDDILGRIALRLKPLDPLPVAPDDLARRLRGAYETAIVETRREGGRVKCALRGKTSATMRISVFSEEDDSVSRQYLTVEPFEGTTVAEQEET